MTTYDIKRLGLILALQAEIDGMKAKDIAHKLAYDSLYYTEDHYQSKAEELRNLAYQPNETL